MRLRRHRAYERARRREMTSYVALGSIFRGRVGLWYPPSRGSEADSGYPALTSSSSVFAPK